MSSEKNPTRERILNSAWKLLEEGGGGAVRMSDIAKAAKISRQALYLHFPTRAEMLVATTHYIDEVHDMQGRLAATRAARSGVARLDAWVAAWGGYLPVIHGVARALLAMKDSDDAARAAWGERMAAMREGCAAAVAALAADGTLTEGLAEGEATDLLWTLLSVGNWEHLRTDCGWEQERYIAVMQDLARRALVRRG